MRKVVILLILFLAGQVQAGLGLNEFLDRVKNRHKTFKAIDIARQAAEDRREAGDISLVPTLSLKATQLADKKTPNFLGATESDSTQYVLGFSKKFSTGTLVNFSASALGAKNPGTAIPGFSEYAQGSLGISLSQSLWRDAFGRGTRIRREKDLYSSLAQKNSLNLEEKNLLIEAEALYWENLYLKEETRQRELSYKRAQKIEKWTKKRVNNGIGDMADLYQAQALSARRELELLDTQDNWTANQKKIREFLELTEGEPLPLLEGDISRERNIRDSFRGKKKILSLPAYLAELDAKAKAAIAEETQDQYRADLLLTGSYNTNSLDQTTSAVANATKDWTNTATPTQSVSLTWVYMFDTSVKDAAISSARREAQSAEFRRMKKKSESDLQWSELIRRNDELAKKIQAGRIMVRFQTARARAEEDKLEKGRSITNNVVLSEEEATTAELNLARLITEQRKLEAQAQLFIATDDL